MTLTGMREKMQLSQIALAKTVGVTQAAISKYETGTRRPSPEVASRIARVFGLSPDEIWRMFYDTESA